jgi:hypothetical protein
MAELYVDADYIDPDYFSMLDGARVVELEARIPLIVLATAKRVAE